MRLYLVRHTHAVTEQENPLRPLSPLGREEARRMAQYLKNTGQFSATQLWHSPLARSRETAQIFSVTLQLDYSCVETADLLPGDDPVAVAARLSQHSADIDIALVGHEPHLSQLATVLLRGKPGAHYCKIRKGAVLAFEPSGHSHSKTSLPKWRLRWHLSPELIHHT